MASNVAANESWIRKVQALGTVVVREHLRALAASNKEE